ncbi:MAG: homoserine O-acetyltransferase MetX [Microthrixaceae bacterium]
MSSPTRPPDDLPASGAWRPGDPVGDRRFHEVTPGRRFSLEGGGHLDQVVVAYETWGTLDDSASNAVLVCHALTGDSHAAGRAGPGHATPGWWDGLIGPGRPLDTDRDFVVCANVLGGCQGSTGPASTDPATGEPYGSTFPVVSIRDMVRAQASLADALGIGTWRAVIGGSMGGMQALEWAVMYPDRVRALVLASTTAAASALQIAWSHIGRMAVEADPRFRGGDFYDAAPGDGPWRGLAVARMCAQVTYRSDEAFSERFHRSVIEQLDFTMDPVFDVEGYLDYQGLKLVRRFDANSYLRLNRAMDLHDVGRGRGSARQALSRVAAPVLVASVRSDGLYPPVQQRALRDELHSLGAEVEWVDIDSPHGHDAFLIETATLGPQIAEFLDRHVPSEGATDD